jgi:hypothetical protein
MLQTHKEQVAADVKFSSNGAILVRGCSSHGVTTDRSYCAFAGAAFSLFSRFVLCCFLLCYVLVVWFQFDSQRQRASEPTLSASAPDARDLAKKRPKRRFKCLTSNCSAKFATEVELRQHIDETHAKHSLASLAFGPPKKPVTRADLLGK